MSWKFEKEKKDGCSYYVSPKIHSIAEFLDCINDNWEDWYDKSDKIWHPQEDLPWFRGCEKDNDELIPGIYRENIHGWKYKADVAEDMKAEFARRAVPFLKQHQHFREGEYLHLMQHYGFPTRLLDWTEGALIALYFAIRAVDIPGRVDCPCVWMLNPSWLNYVNDLTEGNNRRTENGKSKVLYTDLWAREKYDQNKIIYEHYLKDEEKLGKYPIAVFPPYIDARIDAQKSVFTIHGTEKNGFWNLMEKFPDDAQFAKILIIGDKVEIKKIKKYLTRSGITETTLFPDLEGLSREIQEENKMKVKYP
ncbi:MAG: FRG domain-containing protein [Thermoguttaceae bacterium]|jgi:hypothetical protein